jgi:tetratricopeptide (TPR) repeat protein
MSNIKKLIFLFGIIFIGIINILVYLNNHLYYKAQKIEDNKNKIKILERATQFYPSNDLVFYELGKAYFDLGIKSISDKAESSSYLEKSIKNFTRSIRINPASFFSHFHLAQSLLYRSYLSPSFDVSYHEEYKKAALLAGHNSQIFYEVGKIFLSRWPELSEEDREFNLETLRKIVSGKEREKLQTLMQIWAMNVKDYEVMEKILPQDAKAYRMYARFLGEKSLSCDKRQSSLAKAESLEFERAKDIHNLGQSELQYYQLREAFNHFNSALNILGKINFYQSLSSQKLIDLTEFHNLKKSACINLAKCLIEQGQELKAAEGYLRSYLSLEEEVAAAGKLESILRDRGLIEEKLGASFEDLGSLSFQILLYFKQNRYRDIMRVGRLLRDSFVIVPERNRDGYLKVLQLVGDSYQKVDYIYDAGEFYQKALEMDPDNLEILLRMRLNFERLNEEEKVREVDEKIEKLLSPREMECKNSVINKGQRFSRTLTFDGREIILNLDFNEAGEESVPPLVSIFFNGRVVWEDYLKGGGGEGVEEEKQEKERKNKKENDRVISLSLKSKLGKNTLVIVPVNKAVDLLKISYR